MPGIAVLISFSLASGGKDIVATESEGAPLTPINVERLSDGGDSRGGPPGSLLVSIQGTSVGDIPVRILALTYSEFEADISLVVLDQLFPARPVNGATGGIHYIPPYLRVSTIKLMYVQIIIGRDFEQTVILLPNGARASVEIPLSTDDSENEVVEGYLLVVQVDLEHTHPSDAARIQFFNRYILISIVDDDSM